MLDRIIPKLKNKLLTKEIIKLFFLVNVFNIFNFLFHFIMARLLGLEEYGILAVLVSFVFIFGIPSESIQTIVSRCTTKYDAQNKKEMVKTILCTSLKKLVGISFIIFVALNLVSYFFLKDLLKIDFFLIFLTNILIIPFFIFPIIRGILLGQKKYSAFGWHMVLESSMKLIITLILVLLGFGIYGAIGGLTISFLLFLIVSFFFVRDIIKIKRKTSKEIEKISNIPAIFVAITTIIVFFSMDIIIARVIFEGALVGQYAALSMIGKMIYFGTYAIGKFMFPLTSQKFERKENGKNILKKTLLLITLICILVLGAFFFFDELIISIFFGKDYIGCSSLLIFVGLAFSVLSITQITLLYGISHNQINMKKALLFLVFVPVGIINLITFSSSLLIFTLIFITINLLLLLCVLSHID